MGKKVSNGKTATGKVRESQVRSQRHLSHRRAEGSSELPSSNAKSTLVLMGIRWLPVTYSSDVLPCPHPAGELRACSPLLYETNKNILRIHKPAFPHGSPARSGSHSFGQRWAFPLDQWFSPEGVSLSPKDILATSRHISGCPQLEGMLRSIPQGTGQSPQQIRWPQMLTGPLPPGLGSSSPQTHYVSWVGGAACTLQLSPRPWWPPSRGPQVSSQAALLL